MNAINFIKQHGVDKAREVVKCAPTGTNHYCADNYWFWDGTTLRRTAGDGFFIHSIWGASEEWVSKAVSLPDLKRLVESVDVVKQLDFWGRADVGIKKAKEVIKNNTLQASYYQPSSGCYYRYGRNSLYIVRDGEWREIYVGMDSNTLIHTDSLKQAIADYESIYCVADMGDDTHIENHVSPNCKKFDERVNSNETK